MRILSLINDLAELVAVHVKVNSKCFYTYPVHVKGKDLNQPSETEKGSQAN